jgi:hypothetical protein
MARPIAGVCLLGAAMFLGWWGFPTPGFTLICAGLFILMWGVKDRVTGGPFLSPRRPSPVQTWSRAELEKWAQENQGADISGALLDWEGQKPTLR